MESWDRKTILQKIGAAFGRGILLILVLPLVPALILGYPVMPTVAMIGTSLIFESSAAPVGIAFGLSPVFVFCVLFCTECGIFVCLYDIFNAVGHSSPRVAEFLERSHAYASSSPTIARYGIFALVPCEILIGVQVTAAVAWVLGWREDYSLALTLIGYLPQLIITILICIGILQINIPALVHLP